MFILGIPNHTQIYTREDKIGEIRSQKSRHLVTVSTLNEARIQNRYLLTPAGVRYGHPGPKL